MSVETTKDITIPKEIIKSIAQTFIDTFNCRASIPHSTDTYVISELYSCGEHLKKTAHDLLIYSTPDLDRDKDGYTHELAYIDPRAVRQEREINDPFIIEILNCVADAILDSNESESTVQD